MAAPSTRMFRLLTLLQTQRYWTGAELADRLVVSARTLRRDVDRLRELGYPVQAARGIDGGYHLAAGASLPPLAVDDEEAVALALGLRLAAQGSIAGMEDSAVRALGKVMQVMPSRLRRRLDALKEMTEARPPKGGPVVDATVLTDLAEACRAECRVSFAYVAANGERTERDVEPHRLVSQGLRWYLVCYDLGRHDWRSFRLDRMAEVRSTEQRFRPRALPADDAAEFVRQGVERWAATQSSTVRVQIAASTAQVQQVVGGWGRVEAIDDHTCELHMVVEDLSWVAMVIGSVGAEFEVIQPPALETTLAEWADRFNRATSGERDRWPLATRAHGSETV